MVERPSKMIVGLDIGTTKICAVVGEFDEKGADIIGVGTYPSVGLRKGVVVNIDNTVDSIQRVFHIKTYYFYAKCSSINSICIRLFIQDI